MAKEFKAFDHLYREYRGEYFGYEKDCDGKVWIHLLEDDAVKVTGCWRGKDVAKIYTNKEIREAVYFADGFEVWQKFRVSLKGNSTAVKLKRLQYRWKHFEELCGSGIVTEERLKLEQIRIDNYIYALRRGGQLNAQFEIAR